MKELLKMPTKDKIRELRIENNDDINVDGVSYLIFRFSSLKLVRLDNCLSMNIQSMVRWNPEVLNARPGLRVLYNLEIRGSSSFMNQGRLFSVMLSWLFEMRVQHNPLLLINYWENSIFDENEIFDSDADYSFERATAVSNSFKQSALFWNLHNNPEFQHTILPYLQADRNRLTIHDVFDFVENANEAAILPIHRHLYLLQVGLGKPFDPNSNLGRVDHECEQCLRQLTGTCFYKNNLAGGFDGIRMCLGCLYYQDNTDSGINIHRLGEYIHDPSNLFPSDVDIGFAPDNDFTFDKEFTFDNGRSSQLDDQGATISRTASPITVQRRSRSVSTSSPSRTTNVRATQP